MIIICPNDIKDKYLKETKIHNYKFYTLNEIKEKVFFKFHDLALYEVVKEYNLKPEIALRMMNGLYYIDKEYEGLRLKKLFELKNYLTEKNLIIKDNNFLKFLKDEIEVIGYLRTKELDKIINVLSKYTKVTYEELKPKYELKNIYKFHNADLEINFVAENILKLIDSGIDINKIYIINYNNEYIGAISRIFPLFGIPYQLKHKKNITMFKLTKEFLKYIKNSELKVSELNEYLDSLKDQNDEILNQIINVLNKYYKVDAPIKDLYEVICFDLKSISINDEKYTNVVNILDDIKSFNDDEYVFSISNNEVLKYKDNDYLKDVDKDLIDIDTSYELNKLDDINTITTLSNIKNLTLSYKEFASDRECLINHNFEDLEIEEYVFEHNSSKYNKYLFDEYKAYDNSYQKIEFDDLKDYLDGKLNLSDSSMEQFFKCKFRFFLNNILKLDPFEDNMSTKTGNMFHKILERVLKNNYQDYLEIIEEESSNYLNENPKEKFYAEKFKKEATRIVERLKEISARSDFKEYSFEKWIEIPLKSKLKLKLVGKVDKILTLSDENNNYIMVVDYKTGSSSFDLTKVKDGFDMQLLIYLYLIINSGIINNPKIAGAYIDSILSELKPSEYGKKYEDIIDNRLNGITIKDHEILKHIDKYYDVNPYIKGIGLRNDGDFRADARVYLESDFNELFKKVENNIEEVVRSIESCDFEINPKRYYGTKPEDIEGCKYCPFKEVCYMSAKDIKMLKKEDKKEMLGDKNELDA